MAAVLFMTMVTILEAQVVAGPASALTYYATPPGLEYQTVRTVKRDGQVVRITKSTVTALQPVTIDGRRLQVSRSDMTMTAPSGASYSGKVDIYQDADDERSCTFATGAPQQELDTYECEYLDLKGPVAAGATWRCEATTPLDNFEVARPVPCVLESRVEGFEPVDVGGVRLEGCAVVRERIEAAPDERITCRDGSQVLTNVELHRTRVFCPELPDVRVSGTERYLRRDDSGAICTTFETEFEITAISNPGLLGVSPSAKIR